MEYILLSYDTTNFYLFYFLLEYYIETKIKTTF